MASGENAEPLPADESGTLDLSFDCQRNAIALLIHEVEPEYPALARHAHVGGVVQLRAIIGRDGTVQNLILVSGQPLLVEAAMDAVKQWVYKPAYLNGVPVEVVTEVSVHFYLRS
jgi:protein TonB